MASQLVMIILILEGLLQYRHSIQWGFFPCAIYIHKFYSTNAYNIRYSSVVLLVVSEKCEAENCKRDSFSFRFYPASVDVVWHGMACHLIGFEFFIFSPMTRFFNATLITSKKTHFLWYFMTNICHHLIGQNARSTVLKFNGKII